VNERGNAASPDKQPEVEVPARWPASNKSVGAAKGNPSHRRWVKEALIRKPLPAGVEAKAAWPEDLVKRCESVWEGRERADVELRQPKLASLKYYLFVRVNRKERKGGWTCKASMSVVGATAVLHRRHIDKEHVCSRERQHWCVMLASETALAAACKDDSSGRPIDCGGGAASPPTNGLRRWRRGRADAISGLALRFRCLVAMIQTRRIPRTTPLPSAPCPLERAACHCPRPMLPVRASRGESN
jgi:hypothetical protein